MEKTLAYFFVLWHMKNNREHFISVQTVIRQKMCKLEIFALRPKRWTRRVQKNSFHCEKKKLPSFFPILRNEAEAKKTIYSGPQGFLTVIV